MPDMSKTSNVEPTIDEWVNAGYMASNYRYKKSTPEEIEKWVAAERDGTAPPKVKRNINPDMPDISSETDVANLMPNTRFLARFIIDPKGDTGRQARELITQLRSGKMIKHNIKQDYWMNHYLDRPPIAIHKGRGKWELLE